ncbi:sensor histidine kinase [Dactylosporangium sp. CS-033363]|uniref:sensor histidine kinase n=1 Tax=Dactylosporangium sp. CS-033363 TaxID=3239935 RepID=UPI003D8DF577
MELPPVLTRRLGPRGLYMLDAFSAAGTTLVCFFAALAVPQGGWSEPLWLSALVALALGVPVAFRRRWPFRSAFVVVAASMLALGAQIVPTFAAAGPAIALALVYYTFGTVARDWKGIAGVVVGGLLISACMVIPMLMSDKPPSGDSPSLIMASFFGLFATSPAQTLGFAIGERRAQTAARNEQAIQKAAVEERLRVARELHDVIAHTMTLIVVKAAVGNHVADASPAEARDALQVIEKTGRAAMLEVRRVLDMLREDTPYAPTPGLNDLPGLVEMASFGGVRVQLDVAPPDKTTIEEVPESVGLAVYRIVQEAITNVVKHAAPAECRVSIVVNPAEIRIEVNDDGKRPPRPNATGHGLIGMRERVALHGGTFTAGPRAEGGFSVRALLPAGGIA